MEAPGAQGADDVDDTGVYGRTGWRFDGVEAQGTGQAEHRGVVGEYVAVHPAQATTRGFTEQRLEQAAADALPLPFVAQQQREGGALAVVVDEAAAADRLLLIAVMAQNDKQIVPRRIDAQQLVDRETGKFTDGAEEAVAPGLRRQAVEPVTDPFFVTRLQGRQRPHFEPAAVERQPTFDAPGRRRVGKDMPSHRPIMRAFHT